MNVLSYLKKIPEFSDSNFIKASYVCGGILFAIVLFFIYEIFTAADFGISIEWNIFESAWFGILFPIGLVLAIVNWGKFGHWGGQPYNVYQDGYGKKYVEKNNDLIDNLFSHILLPLLGHFMIEPALYACIIYYPLMCVFALLDVILPYAISLLLLVLSVGVLMSSRYFMQMRYRSLVIVCITVFVGGGLLWASINMKQTKVSQTIATEQVNIHEEDDMFNDQDSKPVEIDDMFND
ncbi:MAG: hypothetical protein E7095_08065 [Bacteroides sp.]|nr:hypothetical protein [Bacteroides sp.]